MIRTPGPSRYGSWQVANGMTSKMCLAKSMLRFEMRSQKVASSTTTSAITSAIIWLSADSQDLSPNPREREIDLVLDVNLAAPATHSLCLLNRLRRRRVSPTAIASGLPVDRRNSAGVRHVRFCCWQPGLFSAMQSFMGLKVKQALTSFLQ